MVKQKSTCILNLDLKQDVWIALSQPLLYVAFEFVKYLSTFTFDFIMNYAKESNISYTLSC